MTTTTCKTAKQAANALQKIADNYAFVYECPWISSDMAIYINSRVMAYAAAMKDDGKFSYTTRFYIRHRGVEDSEKRVAELGDKTIAVVVLKYNKSNGVYTIIKENI